MHVVERLDSAPFVTVVGAGVAGLTIAHQLVPHRSVSVVEALDVAGGLARSWHYGDFHFDVGPHRFHTEHPRVAAFIKTVLAEDAIEITRSSGARMFGRFHAWPLRPSVLMSMPISVMLSATRDLIVRERLSGDSFEADIVNKYGRTLYDIFFAPYTEKFLFHSPRDLHRDWGRAGVNRAVIDKRAKADTLWGLLKTTLLPVPVETLFLYAPHGVGRFSERLQASIQDAGGSVTLGAPVDRIEASGDRIIAIWTHGRRLPCQNLVWTGPLSTINRLLDIDDVNLQYLSTIVYNVEVGAPLRHNYQWIYYGGDEVFSRVSAPAAFTPSMAPQGKSGLCVEVTCRQGDARWQDPEQLVPQIVADLVRTGTIARSADVERVHIEPVPSTYPIYTLDYLQQLTANFATLSRYRNLLLAGRSARFWYNNMDHSIGQGLTMADKILKGTMLNTIDDRAERVFWDA
jgi:protoporphyrinogen oxidase